MMIGTSEQYLVTSSIVISAGRFMTKAEAYANRDVCIIGSEVADKLFLNETPLGKKIHVGNETLEVIGVVEKRGSVLGQMSLDNQVIIPIGKMVAGFQWDPSCTIQVKVGDPTHLDAAREELRGLMRKIRKVPPGHDDDFAINQQEQLLTQFKKVSAVIATSGFFITGLSLFVGGIGIMNIMFVSVAERTHEIGIRKAIGAKRRTILLQFLIEAASICLIGGIIALLIARGLGGNRPAFPAGGVDVADRGAAGAQCSAGDRADFGVPAGLAGGAHEAGGCLTQRIGRAFRGLAASYLLESTCDIRQSLLNGLAMTVDPSCFLKPSNGHIPPPLPRDEGARLRELHSMKILDTPEEDRF